jgi:hypothetical protein
MPRLEPAPQDVVDFVESVMARKTPKLHSADVKVDLLMHIRSADEREKDKGQLKLRGYPAAAIARVLGKKDRAKGQGDCEIVIDGDAWEIEADRESTIHHELLHFSLQTYPNGQVKEHDNGRPKIKMRLHDVQLGTFNEIVEEYGLRSHDGRNVRTVIETYRQMVLRWGDDGATQDERPADIAGTIRAAV